MTAGQLAGIGALLSGISAVVTAYLSLRAARRHYEHECDNRIRQLRDAFTAGLGIGTLVDTSPHTEAKRRADRG